jgi:hypothetical protein
MLAIKEGDAHFLASSKDLCEIYEPVINRDGKSYLKILSSKDKSGKFFLGTLKVPKQIRDIPNGNYVPAVIVWFIDSLNLKECYINIDKLHKAEIYLKTKDSREYSGSIGLR